MNKDKLLRIRKAIKWFSENTEKEQACGDVLIYVKSLGFYMFCGEIFAKSFGFESICTKEEYQKVKCAEYI